MVRGLVGSESCIRDRLSMQSYIQPFVSVGTYADFKDLTTPGAFNISVYVPDLGSVRASTDTAGVLHHLLYPSAAGAQFVIDDTNFNSHSLRGNAVFRWEYRPGSTLFLVWQQTREGTDAVGDLRLSRDRVALFAIPPRNIFQIKINYWLSR